MKGKKLLLVTLIIGLLMALTPLSATAAPAIDDEGPECNPRAFVLSELMGVDCSELMDLQESGIGFGVMMKAYFLADAFGLPWQDLAKRHVTEEGIGWGQIVKAYALADALGVPPEELLAQAQKDGWGPIIQEYRAQYGPGKPPWAGQGKPPWAKGQGKDKPERTGPGKPPWAQGRGKPEWAGPPESED